MTWWYILFMYKLECKTKQIKLQLYEENDLIKNNSNISRSFTSLQNSIVYTPAFKP